MFSNTKLLLFCSQIAFGLGMIMLFDECPKVQFNPNANATEDCPPCLDCTFGAGSMCCPNECGTYSCKYVWNSCKYNDTVYDHHYPMPLPNDWENDNCGDCWCQNGDKRCITYSCTKGARP